MTVERTWAPRILATNGWQFKLVQFNSNQKDKLEADLNMWGQYGWDIAPPDWESCVVVMKRPIELRRP